MEFSVFEYGLLLIFPAFMILAGVFDMLTMTIPNRISIILFGAFFIVAFVAGLSWQQIGTHLVVCLGVLILGFILFATGTFGGGDAKLLAASSLWIGFENLLPYVIHVGLLGGVLALCIVMYRNIVPELVAARFGWTYQLHARGGGIPYGIAIAAAALNVFPATAVFQALSV